MYERQIIVDDIINGIETGEIIKQYEDDKPYSSCLILGFSVQSKYIHIVVSCDTDLGSCLLIVRNVPCYKCEECNEIIYTGDVVKRLEQIIEQAKQFTQEISIVNYSSAA